MITSTVGKNITWNNTESSIFFIDILRSERNREREKISGKNWAKIKWGSNLKLCDKC